MPISAIQATRRLTRSVGLGGNGQFSLLSALDVVADEDGPGAARCSRTTSSACT